MATIPSGSKFFSQAESVDTTYGGPAALKGESAWFTIEDIASSITGVPTLDFTWSKEEEFVSTRLNGVVKTLGISINNLTLDPSKTYNLLIKRWRFAEKVEYDPILDRDIYRTAGFKHESDATALENNRQNKINITTTSLTYYNFNQDFFFKASDPTNPTSDATLFPTGYAGKYKINKRGYIPLAFDLEITNEDGSKYVIENIGKITMISNYDGESNRNISYNKIT